MPKNPNQIEPTNRLASLTEAQHVPAALATSRDLCEQAINLLETSWSLMSYTCVSTTRPTEGCQTAYELHRREIVALCESPRKKHALCLANMISHIAIEGNTPCLIVTSNYTPTILAVNLLLWRAGINLEDAVAPVWGQDAFVRLIVASGVLAKAPLHMAGAMAFLKLQTTVRHAVTNLGTQCLVLDDSASMSIEQLLKLRAELPMAIQFLGESPDANLIHLN